MKKSFLIFLMILVAGFVSAGNINDNREKNSTKLISGKIIDKKSGEEIAGAQIRINDKIIYSDLNGNFCANINTSKTEAMVSFVSYSDTKINIDPFLYSPIVIELESK